MFLSEICAIKKLGTNYKQEKNVTTTYIELKQKKLIVRKGNVIETRF